MILVPYLFSALHALTSAARSTGYEASDGALRTRDDFVALMNALYLPKPKRIDEAVPANLTLGLRHDAGAPFGRDL